MKDGELIAVQPYTVLVEVGAAIRRRTGSQRLSERVIEDLRSIETFFFVEFDIIRAQRALEIAQQSGFRGMDAIVVQIAEEFDATLISLDYQMIESAISIVAAKEPSQF